MVGQTVDRTGQPPIAATSQGNSNGNRSRLRLHSEHHLVDRIGWRAAVLRPVDRVAASLVSYIGGGVQPANRSKELLFGDAAPFWRFKDGLNARECPEESRNSHRGLFLIEVFPALALPALNPAFYGRLRGPKYNPANRRFRLQDWQLVAQTVRRYAQIAKLDAAGRGREKSN